MIENNSDYVDIHPWPPMELVGQLVANVALARRGLIESDVEADMFERETDRFELDAWSKVELTSWLTSNDSEVLSAPIGDLTDGQLARCDEAAIMASTIGWAIGIVPDNALPILTSGAPEQRTIEWAPGPWTPVRNVVKSIRVRSDDLLAAERERWELIAWRSTLFSDVDLLKDDRDALREAATEVEAAGLINVVREDFALEDGTAFRDIPRTSFEDLGEQAEIRLRTLNWVCGFGENPVSAPLFLDDEALEN